MISLIRCLKTIQARLKILDFKTFAFDIISQYSDCLKTGHPNTELVRELKGQNLLTFSAPKSGPGSTKKTGT